MCFMIYRHVVIIKRCFVSDVIEDNVDSAANSVEKGTKSLQRASKYKVMHCVCKCGLD